MNVCVREIIEAFPDREVTLTTRPDGRLSLTTSARPSLTFTGSSIAMPCCRGPRSAA